MTVSELLNVFIVQFNCMYVDEDMEREATLDDTINMRQLTFMLSQAFIDKKAAELVTKISKLADPPTPEEIRASKLHGDGSNL